MRCNPNVVFFASCGIVLTGEKNDISPGTTHETHNRARIRHGGSVRVCSGPDGWAGLLHGGRRYAGRIDADGHRDRSRCTRHHGRHAGRSHRNETAAFRGKVIAVLVAVASTAAAYDPDAACNSQPAPEAYALRLSTASIDDGSCGAGCKTIEHPATGSTLQVAFTSYWYAVKSGGEWVIRTGTYPSGVVVGAWTPTSTGYLGATISVSESYNPCSTTYAGAGPELAAVDLAQRTGYPFYETTIFPGAGNLGTAMATTVQTEIDASRNPFGKVTLKLRVHSGSPNVAASAVDLGIDAKLEAPIWKTPTMTEYCSDNPDDPECSGEEDTGGTFDLADIFAGPDEEHIAALEAERERLASWSPHPLVERFQQGFATTSNRYVWTWNYAGTIPVTLDLEPYSGLLQFIKWLNGLVVAVIIVRRIKKDAEEAVS